MLAWRVKIRWRRALVCLLVCLLLIAGGVLLVEQNLTRVVLSLAQAQARALAVRILNEAASELLAAGEVTYDSLMHVTADGAGQVRLIQANTPEMNRLAAKASLLSQEKLRATGARTVEATTQVAMAESIIVGEVPETFTDVGDDMDMLDLVP